MKTKRVLGAIGVAAASIAMMGNPSQAYVNQSQATVQYEAKATQKEQKVQQKKVIHNVGGSGLDLVTLGDSGLSPKEYGMRFGNGKSKKGKTNYLKIKHNYKVKKRMS
ncbi:MAG: hypothetical protein QXT80_03965 [Thermoplasmatales archaeon]